jgi:hypothetical protein
MRLTAKSLVLVLDSNLEFTALGLLATKQTTGGFDSALVFWISSGRRALSERIRAMLLIFWSAANYQRKEEYEAFFEEVPIPFSEEDREEWLNKLSEVAVSSDAFVGLRKLIHRGFVSNNLASSHSQTMSTEQPDQESSTLPLQPVVKMIRLFSRPLRLLVLPLLSKAFVFSIIKWRGHKETSEDLHRCWIDVEMEQKSK